jgi:hypothetical protein
VNSSSFGVICDCCRSSLFGVFVLSLPDAPSALEGDKHFSETFSWSRLGSAPLDILNASNGNPFELNCGTANGQILIKGFQRSALRVNVRARENFDQAHK